MSSLGSFLSLLLVASLSLSAVARSDAINQGWPDFIAYGPNFIKILFCGPQIFFCMFFLKYEIIDDKFGYFSYIVNS